MLSCISEKAVIAVIGLFAKMVLVNGRGSLSCEMQKK